MARGQEDTENETTDTVSSRGGRLAPESESSAMGELQAPESESSARGELPSPESESDTESDFGVVVPANSYVIALFPQI